MLRKRLMKMSEYTAIFEPFGNFFYSRPKNVLRIANSQCCHASLFAGEPNYHTQKPSGLGSVYLSAPAFRKEKQLFLCSDFSGPLTDPPAAETWSQPSGCLWPKPCLPLTSGPSCPIAPAQSPASWTQLVLRRTRSSLSCFPFKTEDDFFLVLKITKACSVNSPRWTWQRGGIAVDSVTCQLEWQAVYSH